jgi:hypothetical protein
MSCCLAAVLLRRIRQYAMATPSTTYWTPMTRISSRLRFPITTTAFHGVQKGGRRAGDFHRCGADRGRFPSKLQMEVGVDLWSRPMIRCSSTQDRIPEAFSSKDRPHCNWEFSTWGRKAT